MKSAKFVLFTDTFGTPHIGVLDRVGNITAPCVGHIQASGMEFRTRAVIQAVKFHAMATGYDAYDLDVVELCPALYTAIKAHNGNLFPLGSPKIDILSEDETWALAAQFNRKLRGED